MCNGEMRYADMEPGPEVLAQFKKRGDNQIASLEILSIALGERVCLAVWSDPCERLVVQGCQPLSSS